MTPRSLLLRSIPVAILAGAFAGAQAQAPFSYYFNLQGSDPNSMATSFEIPAESDVTFSIYGVAPAPLGVSQVGFHFSFVDGTGAFGASGSPANNDVTFVSLAFAPAIAGGAFGTGINGNSMNGATLRYGRFAESAGANTSFLTLSPTPTRLADVTVHVGSIFFQTREFALESVPGSQTFTNYAIDASNQYMYPNRFAVTARAVPEPASLAVLGFGALALLRRRRSA